MLGEIFPIESYDKTLSLQYLKYELHGKPRYGPDECRQLRAADLRSALPRLAAL